MKKLFSIFVTSLIFLFFFSGFASAFGPGCSANNNTTDPAAWNSTTNKPVGLVPCGISTNPDGSLKCPCELGHLFIMILNVYNFTVWTIAFPLAALMIMIGGILMLVSGGSPGLFTQGKNLVIYSAIGLALILGSWLIIDVVLKAIGYNLQWNVF